MQQHRQTTAKPLSCATGIDRTLPEDTVLFVIYSDDHHLHHGAAELNDGQLMPCHERPERADQVLKALQDSGFADVIAPQDFGNEPIQRVHTENYLRFLESAWDLWQAEGRDWDALPLTWSVRHMRDIEPDYIDGKLSYFSSDAGTPITAGTWRAVRSGAQVALTGAEQIINGETLAFALCRPPGHHAAADYLGGYCYLNNAAIAAQRLRDSGIDRVAILDVDYHHGNGTQSIFYDRSDVLFVSVHADPAREFPYFLGHADERGEGDGEGFNLNLPLSWGTSAEAYFEAIEKALQAVRDFAPGALVVSLGVDTFEDDPICQFRLSATDFETLGEKLGSLSLSTLVVFEGGYAIDRVGENVVNVLRGMRSPG